MKIFIKDININYEVSGVGAPLIFLHGWGLDLHTFDNLAKELSEDYSVYQIDLPGFGESDISNPYTIEEYANYINEFCLSLAIINPIIVGHSFGGRVAMMYASRYDVDKLIFFAAMNLKAEGGGVKMAPKSVYDDGKLCSCLAYGIPKWVTFFCLPLLVLGLHTKLKGFIVKKFSKAEITLNDAFTVHTDGEYIEESNQA
mgnify:CR=1 FL=1